MIFQSFKGVDTEVLKASDPIRLPNGVLMPCIGFGTWQAQGDECYNAVRSALDAGYRHIDTATIYENEHIVGKAIADSGIDRKELFITTKLWNTSRGNKEALKAFRASLRALKLDYIDLYLIHWPANKKDYGDEAVNINADTWRALETVYMKRQCRAIGLSNFMPHHIDTLLNTAMVKPMVNQIELHPGFMRPEVVEYCHNNNIVVEAWSPLGCGKVLNDQSLIDIATVRSKTPAQIVINYLMSKNIVPLPKSVTPERIESNSKVFDFDLTPEEIAVLDNFPDMPGKDPDKVSQ